MLLQTTLRGVHCMLLSVRVHTHLLGHLLLRHAKNFFTTTTTVDDTRQDAYTYSVYAQCANSSLNPNLPISNELVFG